MTFAKYFSASIVGLTFDETVTQAAQAGRVAKPLLDAIAAQYGVVLPASPAALAAELSKVYIGGTTDSTRVKGASAIIPMIYAAHAALVIIADSGKVKSLNVPSMAGAWCDPAAIEAKKAAAKTKAAIAKEAKKAASAPADIDVAPVAAPANVDTGLASAVAAVVAAIQSGDMVFDGAMGADILHAMFAKGWPVKPATVAAAFEPALM